MRNYLLNGHTEIFGAGKGIIRSFQDFDLCAEPYMKHPKNTIYYFGDLDYEASVYTKYWQKNFAADGKSFLCAGISGYAWKSRTDK